MPLFRLMLKLYWFWSGRSINGIQTSWKYMHFVFINNVNLKLVDILLKLVIMCIKVDLLVDKDRWEPTGCGSNKASTKTQLNLCFIPLM